MNKKCVFSKMWNSRIFKLSKVWDLLGPKMIYISSIYSHLPFPAPFQGSVRWNGILTRSKLWHLLLQLFINRKNGKPLVFLFAMFDPKLHFFMVGSLPSCLPGDSFILMKIKIHSATSTTTVWRHQLSIYKPLMQQMHHQEIRWKKLAN